MKKLPQNAQKEIFKNENSSVQSLSRVLLFATPWIAARQASLSITNSQSSLRLTSIESVRTSDNFEGVWLSKTLKSLKFYPACKTTS